MNLSCECSEHYAEWYYDNAEEYTTLQTSRRKRCVSCDVLINKGEIVTSHYCFRDTRSEIEEKIYGDEVRIADKYHCERCSDIEFNLLEIGFCVQIGLNMIDLMEEYKDFYLNAGK